MSLRLRHGLASIVLFLLLGVAGVQACQDLGSSSGRLVVTKKKKPIPEELVSVVERLSAAYPDNEEVAAIRRKLESGGSLSDASLALANALLRLAVQSDGGSPDEVSELLGAASEVLESGPESPAKQSATLAAAARLKAASVAESVSISRGLKWANSQELESGDLVWSVFESALTLASMQQTSAAMGLISRIEEDEELLLAQSALRSMASIDQSLQIEILEILTNADQLPSALLLASQTSRRLVDAPEEMRAGLLSDLRNSVNAKVPTVVGSMSAGSPPLPGAGPSLGIAETGDIVILWDPASDDSTPAEELSYQVVYGNAPEDIGDASASLTIPEDQVVLNWSRGALRAELTPAEPSKRYYFTVLVKDTDGLVAQYSVREIRTPPARPAEVQAQVSRGKVTITWSPSEGAAGYRLYWSTSPGTGRDGTLISGVSSPFVHDGRQANVTLYYTLSALGVGGESALSSEIAATPPDATAPVPGSGIEFASVTARSVTLEWSPATDDETPSGSLSYRVVWSLDSANVDTPAEALAIGDSSVVLDWSPAVTSARIEELAPGTAITFAVLVRDAAGNISLYPPRGTTTLPPAPTGVAASGGAGANTVSWNPVSAATGYVLYWSTSPGAESAGVRVTGVSSPFLHSGLAGATDYYYVVSALGPQGEGLRSVEVRATTGDASGPVPGAGIAFSEIGPSSATVSWGQATDALTPQSVLEYRLVKAPSTAELDTLEEATSRASGDVVLDWTRADTQEFVTGLPSGSPVAFAVLVRDEDGIVSLYSPRSVTTRPAAPTGVSVTSSAGRLTVTWDSVPGAATYNLYWSLNPGDGTAGTRVTGVSSPFELGSLASNTLYAVVVTAVGSSGESLSSAEVVAVTPDEIAPVPGSGVAFSAVTASSVEVSWGSAADNLTDVGLIEYKLVRAAGSAAIDSLAEARIANDIVLDWTAGALLHNVTGLNPGTQVAFAVLVRDAQGNEAFYPPQTVITLPQAPSGVVASAGKGSVTVSWSPVVGASSYNVYWSTVTGTGIGGTRVSGVVSPWTHSGLVQNSSHYYVVTAVGLSGESAVSVEAMTTTLDETPPVPGSGLTFSGHSSSGLSVTWGAATDNLTAQGDLAYRLVRAASVADIDTVAEALAAPAGDVVIDWSTATLASVVTGLSPGTQWAFAVLVRDALNNTALYSPRVSQTIPASPAGLAAVAGTRQVDVSWSAVVGASSYTIFWSLSPGVTAASSSVANATSPFAHTGLSAGTMYYYRVLAEGPSGSSQLSSEVSAMTVDEQAPVAGTGISFTSVTQSSLTVAWGEASDDVSSADALQYRLVRSNILADIDTVAEVEAVSGGNLLADWTVARLSFDVIGLAAGSTWSFAVLVEDEAGNRTLLSPQPVTMVPASPTGVSASPSAGEIVVSWSPVVGATSYRVYSSASGGSGTGGTLHDGVTSPWSDSGLGDGVVRYYVVTALNASGESIVSSEVSATTPDGTLPAVGTGIVLSGVTSSSFDVTWGAATDETTAAGDLQYKIVKASSVSAIDTAEEADSVGDGDVVMDWTPAQLSGNAAGLSSGTSYAVAVLVRDEAGNKALYTPQTTVTVPGAPSGLAATPGTGQVTLSWDLTPGALSYTLYWSSSAGVSTGSSSVSDVSSPFVHGGLASGQTYFYRLSATGASGASSLSAEVATWTVDETPPSPGSPISAASVSTTSLTVSWGAGSDNLSAPGSLSYRLVKASSSAAVDSVSEVEAVSGGDLIKDWTAASLSHNVTGLASGTTYWFAVAVRDEGGLSALYAPISVTTAPVAPTGVGAVAGSDTITISWSPVAGATSYNIYRSATGGEGAGGTLISGATSPYADSGLGGGVTRFYVVTALNAGAESAPSAEVSASTPDVTPPTPGAGIAFSSVTSTSVDVSWGEATDAVSAQSALNYKLVRAGSSFSINSISEVEAVTGADLLLNWTPATTAVSVGSLSPGTTYAFAVLVRDTAGNRSLYGPVTMTTAPASPTGLAAVSKDSQVNLTWAPAASAVSYNVYWSTTSGLGTGGNKVSTSATTWSHTGLTNGVTYHYVVSASSSNAEGPVSSQVSSSPAAAVATTPLASGTTPQPSGSRVIYDTVNSRHWAFYSDGSQLTAMYSADGSSWTSTGFVTGPSSEAQLYFADVGGTGFLFALEQSGPDIVLRRGTLSASSVSFESPVTVFDGTSASNRYGAPTAAVASDSKLWVAAAHDNGHRSEPRIRQSVNAASGDLSVWGASTAPMGKMSSLSALVLVPQSGGGLTLFADNAGPGIQTASFDGAVWSPANAGGDDGWLPLVQNRGIFALGDNVNALAIYGGQLYVGGDFNAVGSDTRPLGSVGGVEPAEPTSGLVRWDGSRWVSVGGGMRAVDVLLVVGNDLYAAGSFTNAGGISEADKIARWNGLTWSALGSGIDNGSVFALAAVGSDLYVGGSFTNAAGFYDGDYLLRWNGLQWSPVGGGLNNEVRALAAYDGKLVIGGMFTNAGGMSDADRIAVWDGGSWSAIGGGLLDTVRSFLVSGSDLFVGGDFTNAGGLPSGNGIVRWDGSAWNALGSGVSGSVRSLAFHSSLLYVGGSFSNAGGLDPADRLATWNGSAWAAVGSPTSGRVNTLLSTASGLVAGGSFASADGVTGTESLAIWSGAGWTPLAESARVSIKVMEVLGGNLYVGGDFTDFAGISDADYLVRYDGTQWSAVAPGLTGEVRAIAVIGTDLYVGGDFTNAGGSTYADNIAKWNGLVWSGLGYGVNSPVNALAAIGSTLYVGGEFFSTGSPEFASLRYLAAWDGSEWAEVGGGLGFYVYDFEVNGTDLYVAGDFDNAGNNASADNIAIWTGSGWTSLGNGASGAVYDVELSGTDVYIGGSFLNAGGIADADRVARWNGSAWHAVGGGAGGTVYSLAVDGGDLFVAENTGLRKWDGGAWSSIGSSSSLSVRAIIVDPTLGTFAGGTAGIEKRTTLTAARSSGVSAVADSGGDVHLSYLKSNGNLAHRILSGGTWGAETILGSSGAGLRLSLNPADDSVYAIWKGAPGIIYRQFSGETWDGAASSLSTNPNGAGVSCSALVGGGSVVCLSVDLASGPSPFDIEISTLGVP